MKQFISILSTILEFILRDDAYSSRKKEIMLEYYKGPFKYIHILR